VVKYAEELNRPMAVCFEASCGYGHLYEQLSRLAQRVVVAHPGQLRLIFRSKRKNDRVDAEKLAKLLYLDEVPVVHVPDVNVRDWRSLIQFRNRLIARRTRTKNALRALLRGHGIATPVRPRVAPQDPRTLEPRGPPFPRPTRPCGMRRRTRAAAFLGRRPGRSSSGQIPLPAVGSPGAPRTLDRWDP